jgi:hypothetical protein
MGKRCTRINDIVIPKLKELDQYGLGLLCLLMIEFSELDEIDFESGTDAAMFNIAE